MTCRSPSSSGCLCQQRVVKCVSFKKSQSKNNNTPPSDILLLYHLPESIRLSTFCRLPTRSKRSTTTKREPDISHALAVKKSYSIRMTPANSLAFISSVLHRFLSRERRAPPSRYVFSAGQGIVGAGRGHHAALLAQPEIREHRRCRLDDCCI